MPIKKPHKKTGNEGRYGHQVGRPHTTNGKVSVGGKVIKNKNILGKEKLNWANIRSTGRAYNGTALRSIKSANTSLIAHHKAMGSALGKLGIKDVAGAKKIEAAKKRIVAAEKKLVGEKKFVINQKVKKRNIEKGTSLKSSSELTPTRKHLALSVSKGREGNKKEIIKLNKLGYGAKRLQEEFSNNENYKGSWFTDIDGKGKKSSFDRYIELNNHKGMGHVSITKKDVVHDHYFNNFSDAKNFTNKYIKKYKLTP